MHGRQNEQADKTVEDTAALDTVHLPLYKRRQLSLITQSVLRTVNPGKDGEDSIILTIKLLT